MTQQHHRCRGTLHFAKVFKKKPSAIYHYDYDNGTMYFILSINVRTNHGKIVGHAFDLESAIEEVVKCAREYVLAKSEPLLHRCDGNEMSGSGNDKQPHPPQPQQRRAYFSENSPNTVHQLDVFCQRTDYFNGWFQNEKTQPAELVRRFMYCSYSIPEFEMEEEIDTSGKIKQRKLPRRTTACKVRKKAPHILPVGGFPVDVISSLVDSEQFRKHRKTADENSGPRHTFFSSSSEEEDSN